MEKRPSFFLSLHSYRLIELKYRKPRRHDLSKVTELVSGDILLNKIQKALRLILIVMDLPTGKLKIAFY